MLITEQVIRESLKRIDNRIKAIEQFLNAKPLSEVCTIRQQAAEIVKANKNNYSVIAKKLEPLAKEEKRLMKLAKQQYAPGASLKAIDEKIELQIERSQLISQLYQIERGRSF